MILYCINCHPLCHVELSLNQHHASKTPALIWWAYCLPDVYCKDTPVPVLVSMALVAALTLNFTLNNIHIPPQPHISQLLRMELLQGLYYKCAIFTRLCGILGLGLMCSQSGMLLYSTLYYLFNNLIYVIHYYNNNSICRYMFSSRTIEQYP